MSKALIAMSGGVDSSVAAYLIQQQGYECIGCTMKLYQNEDAGISKSHTCCSLDDVEDARAVAYKLGMQYYVFNFSDKFKETVIDKFVACYTNGLTPNPCTDCNHYMKFDKLFERSRILNCDYIVTGHYARIEKQGETFVLKKAVDGTKDQSYVLYMMNQYQLSRILFPLGEMKKSEIRKIAGENGFVNADKPDSQDICFVPDGNYAGVVELHSARPVSPGDFIDKTGRLLGRHRGIIHYTIGQRKGLGISSSEPLNVCNIDPVNNTVTLGTNEDLYKDGLVASDFNWISESPPDGPIRCKAKIRYRQTEQPATATVHEDGSVSVVFDYPQRAITPGQSVVLYDEDIVLGGGVITKSGTCI